MAKKRAKKQKQAVKVYSSEDQLFNFVLGIIAFFILEAVFMLGGLYLQNLMNVGGSTGIPSLIGLAVWAILACRKKSKKEFYLGGLAISVLVPIILIIVTITNFVAFLPVMYASIIGFIILEVAAALWLMKKR
jgi:hypothetical protein